MTELQNDRQDKNNMPPDLRSRGHKKFFWKWYRIPCNFHKDERILNYDYNQGLKNFKIYHFSPQNAFTKFYKRDEIKTGVR